MTATRRVRTIALHVIIVAMAVLIPLAGLDLASAPPAFAAGPCDPPVTSVVACENSKAGSPGSEWQVDGAGDSTIQGFATKFSVNHGESVGFKVDTGASAYTIDIYRVGWYQGNGARKVGSVTPSATLPQNQSSCLSEATTGLIDCGNWALSATWNVPSDAVSGLYFARLRRSDTGGASQVFFVVRDDERHAEILLQTDDAAWEAYNNYGGNSLYEGGPGVSPGRAYKVSYNRPFVKQEQNPLAFFWAGQYPLVRFLERNGYDVSYFSGVDADSRAAEMLHHKTYVSAGHDEYWSKNQRANVEAARDAGVNLAFFSGNENFWKTRWENSIDGSGTDHRTLVSYKETHAGAKIDPSPEWTGTWRDPRFSPPSDGGRPENTLTGTRFVVNGPRSDAITIPEADGKMRFWRNTAVAALPPGGTYTTPVGTLGFEWDASPKDSSRPAGLFDLSSTTVNITDGKLLQDYGSTYGNGTATHNLTEYRAPSGALVFGAGTVQWSWGLDSDHAGTGGGAPDASMQQATVNLFADMGSQPSTLTSGLTLASASTDTTAPTVTVTSPASGATVTTGQSVTIAGTATDVGGGRVAVVEVSVDNGATWHVAQGSSSWSYAWVPSTLGSATIKVRAVDDSANMPTVPTSVTVNVSFTCPCSIWNGSTVPGTPATTDPGAYELGVKFRSDTGGSITGVRFYKGTGNTGTHTGSLWSAAGTRLATGTFSGETGSGWQTLTFASPVPVTANTTYIASYFAPNGHYAGDGAFFSASGVDTAPLHALRSGVDGANGVYHAVSSAFPTDSFGSANYWVDVLFATGGPDTTPPTVVSKTPAAGATDVSMTVKPTATFTEAVQSGTIAFSLKDAANAAVSGSVAYDAPTLTATFTPAAPLASGAAYTATVSGAKDTAGNTMTATSWSFRTGGPTACPCSIWSSDATPTTIDAGDPGAYELGVKFRSDTGGSITGVRFYKGTGNTGTHTGSLWSAAGTRLATGTFSGETGSGWQTLTFASPVPVTANTTYIASYFAPNGHYSGDAGTFASAGVDNQPLHALRSGVDGANGVYHAVSSAFPTDSFGSANYWVDVLFATGGPDTTPPTLTSRTPSSGATGVSVAVKPTATFNEAVQPGTIGFALKDVQNNPVPGSVAYDAPTLTATFTPSAPLAAGVLYTATVSGTKDTAGNTMVSTSWSFTTSSTSSCPCSIWASDATPAIPDVSDVNPTEVGTRFRADTSGFVAGVRFYKGAGNTGTHTGSLWTNAGVLLATGTFSNETATGWQTLTFASPVAVAANTTYLVSYFAPGGHYSADVSYFNATFDNVPLHALAAGVDGANGVYRSGSAGFPTSTYLNINYWVDVTFTTTALPPDTTAPTVTTRSPAANATGVAVSTAPTATFSEAVQPATIAFTLKDAANVAVPGATAYSAATLTATFTPSAALAPGVVYTATVSGTKDIAGNTMAPTSWSFTAGAPVVFADATVANFSAGTPASTKVVQTTDGEVILAPTAGDEFSGTTLPATFTSTALQTGGTTTVGNGALTINGTRVTSSSTYGAGRSLEFVATFGTVANQNVGFGTTLGLATPWAMFGTSGGTLHALTRVNLLTSSNTNLGALSLNAPHRFRIDWNASNIVFSIDGAVVATHTRTISTAMRVLASDATVDANRLAVDWMRLGPYATSGTFTSRVFDAGSSAAWGATTWNADLPSGSSLTLSVRTGNTASPDGTWSAFIPVTNGGTIGRTARYAQYRVTLTGTAAGSPPALRDVTINAVA